ncbi:MAG: hypothetical protein DMG49_21800 [Acidobacteria bacterium]|nr:MAG: hypothetical protein DMG49_21800 [Acidobacteriota bacterium]
MSTSIIETCFFMGTSLVAIGVILTGRNNMPPLAKRPLHIQRIPVVAIANRLVVQDRQEENIRGS